MPSGIWLDDATYLQTAGQLWAQQQTQNVHAGVNWAQQAMQDTVGRLQQMVPQIPTTPAPAPAAPTPVAPPPVEAPPPPMPAPAPPVPIGGLTPAAGALPAPSDLTGAGITPPPPAPTPPPAPMPVPAPAPSTPDVGQNWAQQQIQNLLNPSTAGQQTPSPTPAAAAPIPGLPAAQPSSDATSAPAPVSGGVFAPDQTASDRVRGQSDVIARASASTGTPAPVIAAIMDTEAGGPTSRSSQGANGFMQVLDQHFKPGENPFDPTTNITRGAEILADNYKRYGSWDKAAAAYFGSIDAQGNITNASDANGTTGNSYVNRFLSNLQHYGGDAAGAVKDVAQSGLSAVNTAVQGVQSAVARTSQFGLGLSSGDAMAFCGPTAAIAFAQSFGRNPTVQEAKQLAQQVGWNPDQGMAGPQSEVQLLKTMGVDAHMTAGVDWAQVGRDASGGNPVILDTPGHYYYVDGYNQQTGQLHVGTSGTDLKGGSEWMTPDQINAMPQSHGGARAAIFADHPLAQSDGLAQSSARLTMGTMQPGSSAPPDLGQSIGQAVGNAPLPFLGGQSISDISGLLGQNSQQLQQGRDLVGGILSPDSSTSGVLQTKANSILQAVQDVGSSASKAGQDLLNQGQNVLGNAQSDISQAPTTIQGILQQNALTSQGIPNIGGQALEGAGNLLAPLGRFGGGALSVLEQQRQQALQTPDQFTQAANVLDSARRGDILGTLGGGVGLGLQAIQPFIGGSQADVSPAVSAGLEAAGVPQPYSQILGQAGNVLAGPAVEAGAPRLLGAAERYLPELGGEVLGRGLGALDRLSPPSVAYASTQGAPLEEQATRMFHGTGSDFPRVDPSAVSGEDNLFGPGYYLTSDPRVAGGVVASGGEQVGPSWLKSSVKRAPGSVISRGYAQETAPPPDSLNILTDQVDGIRQALQNPDLSESGRTALEDLLTKAQTQIQQFAGPNVRAIDVPQNLNLFDMERPVPADQAEAIAKRLWGPDALADPETRAEVQSWSTPAVDGASVYDTIRGEVGDGSKTAANQVLADAGFDGIQHSGGKRIPMTDASGVPIEHDVNVIFPDSLDKVRNAISGTQGGMASAEFAAHLGGAAAGGLAGYETTPDDASPQERALRTALGAGAGFAGVAGAGQAMRLARAAPSAPGGISAADWLQGAYKGGVIGGLNTMADVASNATLSPILSAGAGYVRDLVSLSPGRMAGRTLGAMSGIADWGDHFLAGLSDSLSRPTSLSARAGGAPRVIANLIEGMGALHGAFQNATSELIQRMEMGAAAGDAAGNTIFSPGWKGNFSTELGRLPADVVARAQAVGDRTAARGDLGTLASAFGNFVNRAGPIGDALFPVYRMGMALGSRMVEASPLGLVGTGFDVARGLAGKGPYAAGLGSTPTGTAVGPLTERLTNNIIGTVASMWLANKALAGQVTGDGPTDPGQHQAWLANGNQPNSFIGPDGAYHSWQKLPPQLRGPLMTAGAYADAYQAYAKALATKQTAGPQAYGIEEPLTAAAWQLVSEIGRQVASATPMRTLADLYDAVGSSSNASGAGMSAAGDVASKVLGGMVPASGTVRSVAEMTDPTQRQTLTPRTLQELPQSVLEHVAQNIPGLREGLPARQDVLGRPISNPLQGLGELLPVRTAAGQQTPLLEAMQRLGVAPSGPPATIPYGPANELRLKPQEQRAFEQYRGQILERSAAPLVASPQFQQMQPYAQRAALERIDSAAASAAGRMVLGDIVRTPGAAQSRMQSTGVLAPVVGYGPDILGNQYTDPGASARLAQHQALIQSLLGS
jgi:hypothetical protein